MSRGDTPGNGRAAQMDWPSVRARLLQHVPVGAHGAMMVSVRARDIEHVCKVVDDYAESEDAMAELQAERYRIGRAILILQGDIGRRRLGLDEPPAPDLRTFSDPAPARGWEGADT